jgi:hypothetical protein
MDEHQSDFLEKHFQRLKLDTDNFKKQLDHSEYLGKYGGGKWLIHPTCLQLAANVSLNDSVWE